MQTSGESRREIANVTFSLSSPAQAGDPVFQRQQ